jgi:hypothetical protein
MTALDRRTLLALLAAGVAEAHLEAAAGRLLAWQAAGSAYRPSFFTPDEHRLVDEASELILPATARSPGARAARVADYLDLVAAHSPAETQQAWRRELTALDALARREHGNGFVALDDAGRRAVFDALCTRERQPEDDAARAFVRLKGATIDAYYSTAIGLRQELGYLGPQMLAEFKA